LYAFYGTEREKTEKKEGKTDTAPLDLIFLSWIGRQVKGKKKESSSLISTQREGKKRRKRKSLSLPFLAQEKGEGLGKRGGKIGTRPILGGSPTATGIA